MIGALGSSLLRAAPATHASLFRPLPMAAPHAARGIAAAALPHRIAVRRAPLARLLSGEADRTVVEKATTLIKKALSPKEVKIQVCVCPLRRCVAAECIAGRRYADHWVVSAVLTRRVPMTIRTARTSQCTWSLRLSKASALSRDSSW